MAGLVHPAGAATTVAPRVIEHVNVAPASPLNDHAGSDIVSIEGMAEVAEPTGDPQPEAYVEKYRQLIKDLGADPESFAGMYSAAIRVTPTRFRVARRSRHSNRYLWDFCGQLACP